MAYPEKYDVAVIGGGLGGLSVAIQCAEAGYHTVLFEKEDYPFHKVCGEYISLESHGFLEKLGLPLQEWGRPLITRLQVSDINGRIATVPLPLGGFGISRYTIDEALYRVALAKGVTIHTNTKVQDIQYREDSITISAAGKEITAQVAVGSFGKKSNIDVKWNRQFQQEKAAKQNNHIAVKYHLQYPNHPQDVIALHNFDGGFGGICQVEGDKSCFCYLTTAAHLKAHGNDLHQLEQQVLSRNPALQKILSTAIALYKEPITISQISFSARTQVENHVLLVGDAAGAITPVCGNGMSMALHAGKMAFGQLHLFLQKQITREAMEHNYQQEWNKNFRQRVTTGRYLQRIAGTRQGSVLFVSFMKYLPAIAKKVVASTHGQPF